MTPDSAKNKSRKRQGRPFPWRCYTCRKEEVRPQTIPYTTEVKHDGRVYRLDIPALTIPKCGACGEIVFNYTADDQVMDALRSRVRILTPQQIKAERKALGLQSKELAKRLGVAAATVSRWEHGMLIQSRAMDNLLRIYFAVPEVREVLQGTDQDPTLGVTLTPRNDPAPVSGHNRIKGVKGRFSHVLPSKCELQGRFGLTFSGKN